MKRQPEKKSESLEVRLSYSQKQALIEACQAKGITASEAVREQIEAWVSESSSPSQPFNPLGATWTMVKQNSKKTLATLVALSTGTALFAALPSAAEDELFTAYDRDGNGVLTAGEISDNDETVFKLLDKNSDGKISPDEFQRKGEFSQVFDTIEVNDDGEKVRRIAIERTEIELIDADTVSVHVFTWADDVPPDTSEADVAAKIAEMEAKMHTLEAPDFPEIPDLPDMEEVEKAMMLARSEVESARESAEAARAYANEARRIAIEKQIIRQHTEKLDFPPPPEPPTPPAGRDKG